MKGGKGKGQTTNFSLFNGVANKEALVLCEYDNKMYTNFRTFAVCI